MSTFDELDHAMKSRGWLYDREAEQFLDGERVLDWRDVIGLVPGERMDELPSYQDDQHDRDVTTACSSP